MNYARWFNISGILNSIIFLFSLIRSHFTWQVKVLLIITALFHVLVLNLFSQVNGDYQTRATGNWNANTTWQVYSGGAWQNCAPGDYPGASAGAGTVYIQDNITVTITANVPNSIGSLRIDGGSNDSYVQFNPGVSLTVTGQTYLNSNSNNDEKSILVDAGIFTTGSVSANSNGNSRDAYIRISTGTVTVDGNVTLNSTNVRTYILFTGNGTLNVGGTITGGGITSAAGGGATAPTSGTVNYNNAGAQTVGNYTYYNLTISGSGVKTIATANVAVNNIFSVEGTATASAAPTYGANATLQYNTATDRNAGPEWLATFAATGGVVINNTGDITLNGNKTFNLNVPLTINSGATLNTNNYSLTFGGNFVNNGGTFNAGSSNITITNTGTQNIAGFTTTGSVSMTKTGGTATFTGNVSMGNLTLNGAGGTLNLGTSLNHTVTGTWTRTNGTLNGGSSTLNLQGSVSGTGGTFTAGTGTVNYNGSGGQNVAALTYYNLIISGGGTKTMSGNITVNNILSLTDGNLSLGSSNYNLTIAATGSITGSFDNTHMIVCDGSGSLIRQGTSAANFVMVYPVGTDSRYTPFEITALTATVTGTGSISVRAADGTAPGPPAANSTDLQKYWDVSTTNLSGITADLRMTYINPDEVGAGGDQSSYKPYIYAGGTWVLPASTSSPGVNPMTVTGTNVITGQWTAREGPKTYYSYQSGDWSTALTWTTDPSGTLSVDPAVPGSMDRVVILNGRTVFTSVARSVLSLQINEGGTLDIGSTTGHNFGEVRGKGLLRLQTATFPGGTFTEFVSADGGTVEYYNTANFTLSQYTYNNLIFNLSATGIIATVLGNLTVNGNLTIQQGSFRINDNLSTTELNIIVYGNVVIESNGRITLGTGNLGTGDNDAHRFTIKGNFTNNGEAYFTNLVAADYFNYPNHRVNVVFDNTTSDQDLLINGYTRFYRIEIDKGKTKTFILNIDATAPNLFYLFGRNNLMGVTPTPGPPDINNLNALGLMGGTLRLGTNITVPSLAEETDPAQDLNYHVDEDACLWVDGANVTHTTHASGGTSNSFVLYGKIKMTNPSSVFNINNEHGIVMRETAEIDIQNGTLTTPCIRTSTVTGTHRGSYTQSGGTVTVTGNLNGSDQHPSFSLTWPDMSFNMSGGNLTINQATDGGIALGFSLVIGAKAENISVTGGTVRIEIQNRNANFTSTAPFWNLIINSTTTTYSSTLSNFAGSGSSSPVNAQPLVVLNDFSLTNQAIFNANNQNVTVGHDFSIAAGSTYTPGTNTTIFNGTGGQTFSNNGTITTGLYNLSITNHSNTNISQNLTIRNNLAIDDSCYLQDMGRTISVSGNINNSGTHISQAAGSITLTGNSAQTLNGNGNGAFGNLNINKTGGSVAMTADHRINGNLRLASNHIFNIGIYKLTFASTSNVYDALTGTGTAFSGAKMIQTAGNMSDGGVSKEFGSTSPFLFPFGTGTDYTPARLQFSSAPASWGTVNIKPVARYQNFVTSSNSLDYYWKVTSEGFSGIPANSVIHSFWYVDSEIRGTEANYIPGVYRPYSWTYINDIAQVVDASNEVRFWNISEVDGDYTAGELSAFGTVKVFYSRQNGDWSDPNTWSSVAVGGPVDGALPGISNPVVIGDGSANNHTVTVSVNNITVGGLEIRSGSVLDIGTTTGHNFGALPDSKVLGTGTLRISSSVATAAFPAGDFGNFLSAGGGTVEYYSTGATNFTLPSGIVYYNNLILSPGNANITMPDADMRIYANLLVSGTGTGVAQLNSAAARTLTIDSSVNISSGTLRFMNNTFAQTVYVTNDINISSGALFDVSTATNATNSLYIYGNLNNNGTFDMYGGATTRVTNVYFAGDDNKVISGTGTNEFNYLNVNKGSSRNTILDVTANNLTLQGAGTALVLNNGTFRVSNSSLNMTLATTSAFTIPSSAALSVNEGIVNIGTTNNASDLILNGRLEVINNGSVNIGINGQNYNNDIEYASGGNPEIIVQDNGYLFVNGQIRRPATISTGSLNYTQSGNSTVIIDGRSATTTRGMFEILNDGTFNMSGGNLTISRNFNNILYNELYLNPSSSSVTGGTVILGSSAVTSGTAFNFVSSAPLWNLTVDATTTTKIANQRVYPLTVLNNLTIEGNSEFHANGLNVNIGGNLVNNNINAGAGVSVGGYQPGSLTQTTTINGTGAQTITGSGANLTNFANLVINKTGTLALASNSNLRVNNDLTLSSGIVNDGGNNVTVIGDVYNSAIHISPLSTGGIILNGTAKQEISGNGNGVFGNIELNNAIGFDMTDNTTVNGVLTFTVGNLYIDDYLLTLGENATVGGVPGVNSMIILNGVISDQGVRKLYPSGAHNFTFPVGVSGKYTPARLNVTSNGAAGSITVRPVNYKHPALFNGGTANRLDYYWFVTSDGMSSPVVEHTYFYDDGDVQGDENTFVAGRYLGTTWTPLYQPSDNTINTSLNTITILPSGGVSYIDGEYTAGDQPNFVDLPVYYSRNATSGGNWTDPNAWTLNADGSGGPAPSYPQGNPVVILSGHTITIDANSQNAYSVDINGTLVVGTTLYHNLGHIRGGGTLHITSTVPSTYGVFVFPGGEYDDFMNNPASTINFYNNSATAAYLPLKPGNDYKPYQNVIFSGNGIKYVSAENLRILGNLTIDGGTLDNSKFNKTITILGNWTDNIATASGGFVPGLGTVNFSGTLAQTLNVTNATTTEQFYNFKIDNAAGLTISGNGQASVSKYLYLTNGVISTNATNLLTITNTSASAVIGGGSSSFVNGPLRKNILAGSYFNFPVGNASRYGNLYISSVSSGGYYTAQYYNHNPGNDGFDPNSKINPIDVVSDNEYWRINGGAGTTSYVRVRWDSQSGIIPPDAASRTKLRIVEWNGSAWENRGNNINDGGVNSGTIQTNTAVAVNGNHYFTIGVESLPTATITSGNASICDDGSSANITIELTGIAPWTIKYKVNGANETTINNIAVTPYTLVVSNAIEPLATGGPGNYIFNLSYVSDATGSTGIRDFTTTVTITLYESPNPVISGNTTAAIGEDHVIYSTPNISGHTYLWSYSGPAGTTHNGVLTSNTLDMHWGTVAGTGWVRVTETATTGGCSTTTNYYYVTITDIPNPDVTGPSPVCNNTTVTYRTPKVGTHTYIWSLPLGGGTITGSNTLDTVVVQWTSVGNRRVKVIETGSEARADSLDVTVNPLPPDNNTVSDPSICEGQTAGIIVYSTTPGLSLQLRRNDNNNPVGAPVSTGPGGNITINVIPVSTTVYNVLVTNEYSCSVQITDLSTVTVNPLPLPTITGTDNACQGTVITYSTENGMTNYTWLVSDIDPTAAHTIISGGGNGDNTIQIRWDGYGQHRISVNYTDGAGCTATTPTELSIWMHKVPETGPSYYIPNDHNK